TIAVACGAVSGVFVLDIDAEVGGAETLAALIQQHGELPRTWHNATGKGEHYWFRLPKGRECRNTAGRLGKGLDTRGEGGYVVAPGSRHPNGRYYEWLGDGDPRDVDI